MCNRLVVIDVFCVFFNRESLRFCVKRVKKSVGRNQRKFNVNVYLWHYKVGICIKRRDGRNLCY